MSTQLHEGNRLKYLVEQSQKPVAEIFGEMGLNDYSGLYYYYGLERIKLDRLKKFFEVLGITEDQFFKVEPAAKETLYALSTHHGRNLESIMTSKNISKEGFADRIGVSRQTLYNWFRETELPLQTLLLLANGLEIPVARIKGHGETEKSFEREIYLELQQISERLASIEKIVNK